MTQPSVILLVTYLFISSVTWSQQKIAEPRTEIEKYFTAAQKGNGYYIDRATLDGIDSKQFLKIVTPYLKLENAKVRYGAIDIIKRKALLLPESTGRSQYIHLLIEACRDKDSGNSGAASKALTRFRKTDFDEQGSDSLFSLLKSKPYYYERVIQLVGFVQPANSNIFLKEKLLNDSTLKKRTTWATYLALARTGDTASLKYCMEKVRSVAVNDQVVDYLFPDLLYTRQPEAIQYMLNEILSDKKKCSSSNPDSDAEIICAYRIMELVAPVITNFPLSLTDGELDLDDYDAALITVRDWIRNSPVLEINSDFY
jgi:hypothetical protein